jgi:hypothetical protein
MLRNNDGANQKMALGSELAGVQIARKNGLRDPLEAPKCDFWQRTTYIQVIEGPRLRSYDNA